MNRCGGRPLSAHAEKDFELLVLFMGIFFFKRSFFLDISRVPSPHLAYFALLAVEQRYLSTNWPTHSLPRSLCQIFYTAHIPRTKRRQAIDRRLSRHVLWRNLCRAWQSCGKLVIFERYAGKVCTKRSFTEDLNKMYKIIALKARDFIMLVFC